jgi:hypothetical protein
MATVEFRYDPKNTAWFTANAAMVLKAGEPAYHDTTGLFKLGDGVTALSALSFLPIVSSSSATIQQVLTAGQVATTTIETTGFIKTGGTSAQFLKADGSVDSSTYLTSLGTAATSLTTNNSSGAATLISNVLNVPNYTLAGLGGTTLAAVNAQNLSVFAATTSSQLAGVISDETGTGALVFGTNPTFTTQITTPLINPSTFLNIGNAAVAGGSLSKVRVGLGTGIVDIGEYTSGRGAIWVNQSTPTNTNWALSADTSNNTFFNGGTSVRLLVAGNIMYSLFNNLISYTDAVNTSFGTTTGTKLGTATTQKLSFWNATPIVQPTTAVAAAAFVANTSLIANDTATFDGYTIGQIVKALRNAGLLA